MQEQEIFSGTDHTKIEVAGYPVTCISSNIRSQDSIHWNELTIVSGVGHEGNIIVAQIVEVGARKEMERLISSEPVDIPLHPGDYIVGVLANRHSGTSEYGDVPEGGIHITNETRLDLLAAGGVLGICKGVPKSLGDFPTMTKTIGLLAGPNGEVLDLRDLASRWDTELVGCSPMLLSCGTAAEIGKTTTARSIISELIRQGITEVAAAKLAGTGRKRDIASMRQAGAFPALDYPEVGLATTYTSSDRFIPAIYTLLNKISTNNPQIIVAECGGDIIEGNIPALLQDANIMRHVVGIIHSSTDVLSILGSLVIYKQYGVNNQIPIYLTYPIRRNYVAIKERLQQLGIDLPIFDPLNNDEIERIVQNITTQGLGHR